MRSKSITLGFDSSDKAKILHDQTVPERDQRRYFGGLKSGALPKGIVRVEVYVLNRVTVGAGPETVKEWEDQATAARIAAEKLAAEKLKAKLESKTAA